MNKLPIKLFTVVFIFSLPPCFASDEKQHEGQAIARNGEEVAMQCVSCHGKDGNSVAPNFPRIAGQYADYMFHSLKAYKNGDRKNAIMAGIVTALTAEEMKNVAMYYANKSGLSAVHIGDESMR